MTQTGLSLQRLGGGPAGRPAPRCRFWCANSSGSRASPAMKTVSIDFWTRAGRFRASLPGAQPRRTIHQLRGRVSETPPIPSRTINRRRWPNLWDRPDSAPGNHGPMATRSSEAGLCRTRREPAHYHPFAHQGAQSRCPDLSSGIGAPRVIGGPASSRRRSGE
jgi:hypothetical protein